jgi:serine/threonine protein kinase/Tol biopolymer transport system component
VNLIGKTLGQYQIVELIGTGGMASVYRAYQSSLDRSVAIKVLPAQHALTPGYKDRFILEAKAVGQLSHPNILPIYDFGIKGDLSYFVMKYVPDHTLSQLLGKPLPLSRVSHFMNQIAGALDHAHSRGILHRDIKPANILLEGDWLLLADFGVAKIMETSSGITTTGHIFGSPAYVSPEQAEGDKLDHRTDIYSLGVVLYEMVTGWPPFQDSNPMKVILKHIHELPPAPRSLVPSLPEAVEQVVVKALAKNPADRFNSAQEMVIALQQAIAQPKASSAAGAVAGKIVQQPVKPTAKQPAQPQPQQALAPASPAATPAASKPAMPSAKPARSASRWGLGLAAAVVLVLIIGALTFFSNGRADQSTPVTSITTPQATPSKITPTAQKVIPTLPSPTATPIKVEPTATVVVAVTSTPPTATPRANQASAPVIAGKLAIPVKFGIEFKVFVTGFDGAGLNGATPVSLGNARQPMFRPDGQALLVNGANSVGELRGIFVTDSQGQAPRPLNDRGQAYWPVWSPDGTEIIFVDFDQGRGLFRQASQLATSPAAISQLQVNNAKIMANNLVWSDDNRLAFQACADWAGQAGECGIWVTAADAINPVRLTTNNGLPMDAGKGKLIYLLAQDGDWDIYLMSLDGGEATNLTANTSQDGLPALAPDGRSVVYVSNESGSWAVWTVTLNSLKKQKWFELDPQRGTIDVNLWTEEHISWTK